jgi:hypothetical protein
MDLFPADIFTERTADPNTLAKLGPLRRLAGVWQSSAGVDINPKAAGPERRQYRERIELQPIDSQSNGPQLFYGLRYHTHILASDEQATFHDQVGYWLWEPATGLVLTAERGQTEYGICSTGFLEYAFRTDSYRIEVVFNPDGSWSYVLETMLRVRGRDEPFLHRDTNTLIKIAEPTPNPLARLCAAASVAS